MTHIILNHITIGALGEPPEIQTEIWQLKKRVEAFNSITGKAFIVEGSAEDGNLSFINNEDGESIEDGPVHALLKKLYGREYKRGTESDSDPEKRICNANDDDPCFPLTGKIASVDHVTFLYDECDEDEEDEESDEEDSDDDDESDEDSDDEESDD